MDNGKTLINKLLKEVLKSEDEHRPSDECYPQHLNLLCQLFDVLSKEFNHYNGKLSEEVIEHHIRYLTFAQKMVESGISHAKKMQESARVSVNEQGEEPPRPPSYSSSLKSTTSDQPFTDSLTSEGSLASRTSLSTRGERSSISAASDDSFPHMYAPLNLPQYEMFAPESPMQRIHRQNRSIEERLSHLTLSANPPKRDSASLRLRLERQKCENLQLGEKEQKQYLKSITLQATRVCNDSVSLFRKYTKHFQTSEFQLLYRQSALYNSFYLHENVFYQRLFKPRRVADRCVTFMLRDPRHPLVSFMRALPQNHLEELKAASEIQELAEKKTSVETVGRAFAKDLKLLTEVVTLIISHSDVNCDNLEVMVEEAEDLLPNFSRTIFSHTQEGRELHRVALEQLTQVRAEDVRLLMQMAQRSPLELRNFAGVDAALVSASPEEDIGLFAEGARLISQLQAETCPFGKLRVISQATTALVEAATRGSGLTKASNLGADELTPIFAYGVLLWRQPHLPAQCQFVECFVPDEALLGLDGYSLISMITSIDFCVHGASEREASD